MIDTKELRRLMAEYKNFNSGNGAIARGRLHAKLNYVAPRNCWHRC